MKTEIIISNILKMSPEPGDCPYCMTYGPLSYAIKNKRNNLYEIKVQDVGLNKRRGSV